MYITKYSENHNTAEVHAFIRQNGFGLLVASNNDKISATHIPMVLEEDGLRLTGHVAKANPHWKSFATSQEVMAVFQGPHTYISSSWYDHENVPTWNYIAAHVYGTIRIIEGEELVQSLATMVDKYEKHSANPVSIKTMSTSYFQKEVRGLVGFEIQISRIEAAYKLSQNRDDKNFTEIINQLEKRNLPGDKEIAGHMREVKSKKT